MKIPTHPRTPTQTHPHLLYIKRPGKLVLFTGSAADVLNFPLPKPARALRLEIQFDGAIVISRFLTTAEPNVADKSSEQVIKIIPHPSYEDHNSPCLADAGVLKKTGR